MKKTYGNFGSFEKFLSRIKQSQFHDPDDIEKFGKSEKPAVAG